MCLAWEGGDTAVGELEPVVMAVRCGRWRKKMVEERRWPDKRGPCGSDVERGGGRVGRVGPWEKKRNGLVG